MTANLDTEAIARSLTHPYRPTRMNSDAKEELVAGILNHAGFATEREPDWVSSGEVPDFFCSGPADLWAEVKSIAEPARHDAQGQRFLWLRDRAAALTVKGSAFAWVDEDCSERDIKAALALARDVLGGRVDWSGPRSENVFAIVPHDPDYSARVKITAKTNTGAELIFAVRSHSGRYGRPHIADELFRNALLEEADGSIRKVDAFEIGLGDDDFAVGLELKTGDKQFKISAVSLTGAARKLTTRDTVRRAAKKANDQFKNACRYRIAPCLLFVFEDGVLVQELT